MCLKPAVTDLAFSVPSTKQGRASDLGEHQPVKVFQLKAERLNRRFCHRDPVPWKYGGIRLAVCPGLEPAANQAPCSHSPPQEGGNATKGSRVERKDGEAHSPTVITGKR